MEKPEMIVNREFIKYNGLRQTLGDLTNTMIRYIKSIGAEINYCSKEISVFPDPEFMFQSLAFMPDYFPEIKEGDQFKLIINGDYSYDVIFRGRINQTDDNILHIGWLVDLTCLEPVECLTVDIKIIKEDEHD